MVKLVRSFIFLMAPEIVDHHSLRIQAGGFQVDPDETTVRQFTKMVLGMVGPPTKVQR